VSGAVGVVDGCFHLAAIASVERGREEWLATHRVNLGGTVALLDAARRARRGKPLPLVYASSAAVYGDSDALPLAETSAALPISAYGADKLGSELHARVGGRVHGLPTAGLRFFNIYGPRQDPRSPYSGVISIFCDRLRQGQPITIFGDGKQERDFVFVADAVQALLAAMAQASIAAPVWNVCSGRAISVLGLAETIARLCGTPLEIAFAPPRAGDIKRSLGDGTAIEKALGWRPQVTLEEGLRRTLDFLSLSP
jgi:UDP-glucose 4-epimerase